jgi:DNA-binding NarL/FixJ family response regulator
VPGILLASDAEWVIAEIRSVLAGPETTVRAAGTATTVAAQVTTDRPDLVMLDMQMGTMGGIASCLDLRLEEGAGRAPHVPVLILLDRRADVFLARRSGADGWLIKPLDPVRIRRATQALLSGQTYFDDSYKPRPVLVSPVSDTIGQSGK